MRIAHTRIGQVEAYRLKLFFVFGEGEERLLDKKSKEEIQLFCHTLACTFFQYVLGNPQMSPIAGRSGQEQSLKRSALSERAGDMYASFCRGCLAPSSEGGITDTE